MRSNWRYLAAFLAVAFFLYGWTRFQLRTWENAEIASKQDELSRFALHRAALVSNWLTERDEDVQDLSARIWIAQILGRHPSAPLPASLQAEINLRMYRFAQTYGYTGVAVFDRRGQLALGSRHWNLPSAQISPLVASVRAKCASILDVVHRTDGTWTLIAVGPVIPPQLNFCVQKNIQGFVAVTFDANQLLLRHLHLSSPPKGMVDLLIARDNGAPILLTRLAESETSARKATPVDAALIRSALQNGDGLHSVRLDNREFWYYAQSVPLINAATVAYIDRDVALAQYDHNRHLLLLFDALILLIIAGVLIALRMRLRARALEHELEAHREVVRLREYARRIVEESPVGLVILDADWRIVTMNRSFRQMAGVSEREESHDSVEAWIEADPVGPLRQWLPHQVHDGVAKLRSRSGRLRQVHLTLSEVTESCGEGGHYLLTVEDLSHRKWMEERYRLLFEQNVAGIVQTNFSGDIIDCNDAYARIVGFRSRLDLLSRSMKPFYRHEEDRGRMLTELRQSGRVDGYEVELKRRDGSSAWALVSASILVDEEDQPPVLQKTFVDITQRRLGQEMIEKQARLLDLTRDAVIVTDFDGAIRFWNKGAHFIYGWTGEEALGQNLSSLLQSQFSESLESVIAALLQLGHWEGEIRQKCHDDRPVDVFSRWVLRRGPHGEPESILMTNSDITQRKATETALAESNRRIIEIFDSIGEGFLALDREWRFTYVNREGERLLRRSQPELLTRRLWEVFPFLRSGPFFEHCQRALTENVKVEFEAYSQTLGIWLEVHAYPSPSGLSLYFRDVSERRSLRIRLRQAEKMDAVGRLAGGIAHDFNNILNVIAGYAELLAQSLEQDGKLGRYAQEIVNASMRAGALTRQLLAFGRRQRLSPKVLNLNAVLEGMQPLVQRLIGEDIELTAARDPALGNVQADSSQIEQVILNLAANARDAMPNGGKLLIETSNLDLDEPYEDEQVHLDPGRYILLSVSDTGAGMDSTVRERIFEPFFTTKDVGKGTGLGLSTVDGVVQQSGGAIWVYSRPGLGTTFKIYLPRVEEETEKQGKPTGAGERVRGGSESVLLVEDEESLRAFAREVLDSYGYRVVSAGSGFEALRQFKDSGPFQIVVTDVVMPGMGGAELVKQLSRQTPDIRVLYVSGYTGRAMLRQGRLQPGARFLAKPFTAQHLARTVRECLDQPISSHLVADS